MSARHDFYQDDSRLTISIYRKKVVESELIIDVQSDSLELSIGDEVLLNLQPLYGVIIPEETVKKVFGTKVELQLKKSKIGITWPSLTRPAGDPTPVSINPIITPSSSSSVPSTETESTSETPTQLPTGTQARKKSKFESLQIEDEDQEPPGTSEKDLEKFFQKIYGDLPEEGRRAMMKSYVESGGTVLSTDWGDVGGRKVEAKPPA